MKVKICGIKSEHDLAAALNAGADAVGFITDVPVDSPRKINLVKARSLIEKVPLFVTSVLVIMPENAGDAVRMIEEAMPAAVQIHNSLPSQDLKKIRQTGVKLIKTVSVSTHANAELLLGHIRELYGVADAVLLDTVIDGKIGGTGMPHDWELSSKIVLDARIPVILAGGLNPTNIQDAVRCVHPYAVDTASGVETSGRKDEQKVIDFIKKAKMHGI